MFLGKVAREEICIQTSKQAFQTQNDLETGNLLDKGTKEERSYSDYHHRMTLSMTHRTIPIYEQHLLEDTKQKNETSQNFRA